MGNQPNAPQVRPFVEETVRSTDPVRHQNARRIIGESIQQSDTMPVRTAIAAIKGIIKSSRFSNAEKYRALQLFKDMMASNKKEVLDYAQQKIMKRLFLMASSSHKENILVTMNRASKPQESQEFYELLLECFAKWSTDTPPAYQQFREYAKQLERLKRLPVPFRHYQATHPGPQVLPGPYEEIILELANIHRRRDNVLMQLTDPRVPLQDVRGPINELEEKLAGFAAKYGSVDLNRPLPASNKTILQDFQREYAFAGDIKRSFALVDDSELSRQRFFNQLRVSAKTHLDIEISPQTIEQRLGGKSMAGQNSFVQQAGSQPPKDVPLSANISLPAPFANSASKVSQGNPIPSGANAPVGLRESGKPSPKDPNEASRVQPAAGSQPEVGVPTVQPTSAEPSNPRLLTPSRDSLSHPSRSTPFAVDPALVLNNTRSDPSKRGWEESGYPAPVGPVPQEKMRHYSSTDVLQPQLHRARTASMSFPSKTSSSSFADPPRNQSLATHSLNKTEPAPVESQPLKSSASIPPSKRLHRTASLQPAGAQRNDYVPHFVSSGRDHHAAFDQEYYTNAEYHRESQMQRQADQPAAHREFESAPRRQRNLTTETRQFSSRKDKLVRENQLLQVQVDELEQKELQLLKQLRASKGHNTFSTSGGSEALAVILKAREDQVYRIKQKNEEIRHFIARDPVADEYGTAPNFSRFSARQKDLHRALNSTVHRIGPTGIGTDESGLQFVDEVYREISYNLGSGRRRFI